MNIRSLNPLISSGIYELRTKTKGKFFLRITKHKFLQLEELNVAEFDKYEIEASRPSFYGWFPVRTIESFSLDICQDKNCQAQCKKAHSEIELILWTIDKNDEVFSLKEIKKQLIQDLELYVSESISEDDSFHSALSDNEFRENDHNLNKSKNIDNADSNEQMTVESFQSMEQNKFNNVESKLIDNEIFQSSLNESAEQKSVIELKNDLVELENTRDSHRTVQEDINIEDKVQANTLTERVSDSKTFNKVSEEKKAIETVVVKIKPHIFVGDTKYFINMCCDKCLKLQMETKLKYFKLNENIDHSCKKDIFIAAKSDNPIYWYKVKDKLCKSLNDCPKSLLCENKNCNFFHSTIEKVFHLYEINISKLKSSFPIVPDYLKNANISNAENEIKKPLVPQIKKICKLCYTTKNEICSSSERLIFF